MGLGKVYDTLDPEQLWQVGASVGYPLTQLYLALSLHFGPRRCQGNGGGLGAPAGFQRAPSGVLPDLSPLVPDRP